MQRYKCGQPFLNTCDANLAQADCEKLSNHWRWLYDQYRGDQDEIFPRCWPGLFLRQELEAAGFGDVQAIRDFKNCLEEAQREKKTEER